MGVGGGVPYGKGVRKSFSHLDWGHNKVFELGLMQGTYALGIVRESAKRFHLFKGRSQKVLS